MLNNIKILIGQPSDYTLTAYDTMDHLQLYGDGVRLPNPKEAKIIQEFLKTHEDIRNIIPDHWWVNSDFFNEIFDSAIGSRFNKQMGYSYGHILPIKYYCDKGFANEEERLNVETIVNNLLINYYEDPDKCDSGLVDWTNLIEYDPNINDSLYMSTIIEGSQKHLKIERAAKDTNKVNDWTRDWTEIETYNFDWDNYLYRFEKINNKFTPYEYLFEVESALQHHGPFVKNIHTGKLAFVSIIESEKSPFRRDSIHLRDLQYNYMNTVLNFSYMYEHFMWANGQPFGKLQGKMFIGC